MAVQICIRNALSLAPINVFTLKVCFNALKNSSISQRSLCISHMVDVISLKLLVSIFISSCFFRSRSLPDGVFLDISFLSLYQ